MDKDKQAAQQPPINQPINKKALKKAIEIKKKLIAENAYNKIVTKDGKQ